MHNWQIQVSKSIIIVKNEILLRQDWEESWLELKPQKNKEWFIKKGWLVERL